MTAARAQSPRRHANALRVASVQLRSVDDLQGNIEKIETILAECAEQGVQIATFPECAVTGYETEAILRPGLRELRAIEKCLAEACRKNRIHALIGIPYRKGGQIFNTALIINNKGKLLARQCKVHLVGQDRAWNCTPGGKPSPIFKVGRANCALFICHDSRYPELARLPVLKGSSRAVLPLPRGVLEKGIQDGSLPGADPSPGRGKFGLRGPRQRSRQ